MTEVPLSPKLLALDDRLFQAILSWPFEQEFVSRILAADIPHRVKYGNARLWAYLDPQQTIVGFGSLDVSLDCSQFTDGRPHTYIPLIAVNPGLQGRGHGTAIVNHLVHEATLCVSEKDELHPALFLDVYAHSVAAIRLYLRSGFETLDAPIIDADNGEPYLVMAKWASAGD